MVEVQDKGCRCTTPSVEAAIIRNNNKLLHCSSSHVRYKDTYIRRINELALGLGKFKDERNSGKYKVAARADITGTSTDSYIIDEKWMRVALESERWHPLNASQSTLIGWHLNSLRPRRNRHYNAGDIFKCIFLKENVWIPTKFWLKFIPKGPFNNIPALVQIMAWRRPGDKPLSGPLMVSLLTHICITRPHWVNSSWADAPNTYAVWQWFNVCTLTIWLYQEISWHILSSEMRSLQINLILFHIQYIIFLWY